MIDAVLDPAEYFARIGFDGPTEPTEGLLHALVAAHGRSIPFENLDPLLGVPVGDLTPAPLVDKLVRRRRGGYCYEHNGEDLILQAHVRQQWRTLYEFTTAPRPRIDLEVGSWYVSTHPASKFVIGLTAALVTDDARYNLSGRTMSIHRRDGSEQVRFETAAQVLDVLDERFNVDVDDLGARNVVEARVAQVLDA